MEKETGVIVNVSENKVVVEMQAGEKCSHCSAKGACSGFGNSVRRITVPTTGQFSIGDQVWLSYKPSSRVLAALLIFIMPIVFLIGGYVVATSHGGSEGWGVLGSLIGLVIGFVLVRSFNNLLEKKSSFLPAVTKAGSEYFTGV